MESWRTAEAGAEVMGLRRPRIIVSALLRLWSKKDIPRINGNDYRVFPTGFAVIDPISWPFCNFFSFTIARPIFSPSPWPHIGMQDGSSLHEVAYSEPATCFRLGCLFSPYCPDEHVCWPSRDASSVILSLDFCRPKITA